jgi:hypothetical protein
MGLKANAVLEHIREEEFADFMEELAEPADCARAKLLADFRTMSDDELNVRIFDVVLRRL